jgi:peptidoglycan/LPS O-acetylase OafA/YrhL
MTTTVSPDRQPRYTNIDVLRAFAILLVMIVHFPRLRQFFPFLNPWSGVDLFFAISGFVVAKSFVESFDRALNQSSDNQKRYKVIAIHTKAFFVRRFMRITPPVVFALVFYLPLGFYIAEPNLASPAAIFAEVFAIFTYTANFFAGYRGATSLGWHWSLAAEEQFYFVFPFFIAFLPKRSSQVLFIVVLLVLLSCVIRPALDAWTVQPAGAMYLPYYRNDAIGYGFLIFAAYQQEWFSILRPKLLLSSLWLRFSLVFILVAIIGLAPHMAVNFNFAIPIIGISSALLLLIALWSEGPIVPFKPLYAVLHWIGLRSFGIYLLHVPVVRLTQHIEGLIYPGPIPYAIHFAIVVTTLVGVTELCYRIVELPTMSLGRVWSKDILKSV